MSRAAIVIFLKEVVDNLRDRRSVGTALLSALLGPILLIPLLVFQSTALDRDSSKVIHIPVQGADQAPGLIAYLRQRNIEADPAPPDPAEAVRDLRVDLVLVIPSDYAESFRAGRPAPIRIVTDHSRTTAAGHIRRMHTALDTYSRTVGALRLVARGVSPSVVSALAIGIDDVATPESEGALLLQIVPMFLMMSVFFGGMYVAVDVTAGERERGSLEPLMATPITAGDAVLGKLAAVMFFAFATMFLTLAGFMIVINLPVAEVPGMRFRLSLLGGLSIFASLVPVLLPVAALQMLVAGRSKTVKEALTGVSICSMLPMIPGLLLIFSPFKSTTSAMAIPMYAQNMITTEVLKAEPLGALDLLVAAAVATLVGALLASLTVAQAARARRLSL